MCCIADFQPFPTSASAPRSSAFCPPSATIVASSDREARRQLDRRINILYTEVWCERWMLVAPWANRKWWLSLFRSLRISRGGAGTRTRCGQWLHWIWGKSQRLFSCAHPLAGAVLPCCGRIEFLAMNLLRTRLTAFFFLPRQSKLSPSQLDELQKATHFDKKELQQWYKGAWNLG